ncbi:SRP-independent targeting protein 3 [Vanrija pseudolonga]|uniref:SRP-independent targeting protein 3 n=1 Tax=Vanrija pseudolonga TaxID=143232 RepID=A0AAF1BQK9_9TREE|nr:SRP-independent targeting protein 3 [Vanrija pseudolonga]
MANDLFVTAAATVGAMAVGRTLPKGDPKTDYYIKVGYLASQVASLALYGIIVLKIKKQNDKTVVKIIKPKPKPAPGTAAAEKNGTVTNEKDETLKDAADTSDVEVTTTTARDYDLQAVKGEVRSTLVSAALYLGVLYLYLGFNRPLFTQTIKTIAYMLLQSKQARIHLWGEKPVGDLARPFKDGRKAALAKLKAAIFGGAKPVKKAGEKKSE